MVTVTNKKQTTNHNQENNGRFTFQTNASSSNSLIQRPHALELIKRVFDPNS